MDKSTAAIRDMYEQYPYPSGTPVNRVGSDAELLLSYGAVRPPRGKAKRHVLDAGCGRGLGVIGAASLQPDVRFVGADINRVALAEARAESARRGLQNVSFVECDMMTLEGLTVPAGGFDVIHSSGVLHHLSDPQSGLIKLREVLAPHGLINLMVYGAHGREPLMHIAAALNLMYPTETPLAERIPMARAVAGLARKHVLPGTRFEDTADVDDVELVDRVLNVNETSYDVPGVLDLLGAAGLGFVRWIEPADWDPARQLPAGPVRDKVQGLEPAAQWRFLELLLRPAGLEMVVGHAGNGLRPALTGAEVPGARLRVNPELVIATGVRHAPAEVRTETLTLTLRTRDPLHVTAGPSAAALLLLRDEARTWTGAQLVKAQQKLGTAPDTAVAVILELLKEEVLVRAD